MKRVVMVIGREHYDASTRTSCEPDDVLLRQLLLAKGIDVEVVMWNDPLMHQVNNRRAQPVKRYTWRSKF